MVMCAADGCDSEFEKARANKRFCSDRCRARSNWRRRSWGTEASFEARWATCANARCRKTFLVTKGDKRYCSHDCNVKDYQRQNSEVHNRAVRRHRNKNLERTRVRTAEYMALRYAKARAYDRIVEIGGWWAEVKQALQERTDIPEPPMASLDGLP